MSRPLSGSRAPGIDQALKLHEVGRDREAQAICEQILKKQKNHYVAMRLMCSIALRYLKLDLAERYARRCVQVRPNDPGAHADLASVLNALGDHDRALEHYDAALRLAPDDPQLVCARAEFFERIGRYDEARHALQSFVEAGSDTPTMASVWARLDLHDGRFDSAVDILTRHLEDASLPTFMRKSLLYLLGQAHEKAQRFGEAMTAYNQANELLSTEYNPKQWTRTVDGLIKHYSKSTLARLPHAGGKTAEPVFIVGMPRSGSTLIEQVLGAHPKVYAGGELDLIPLIAQSLQVSIGSGLAYPVCINELSQEDVDRLSQSYLKTVRQKDQQATRIVDKMLLNFEHLGLIELLFPQARIIHATRDAVDMCLSCYTSPLVPKAYPYASTLEGLGHYHRAYQRLMDHWREVLSIPMIDIAYEELVDNQQQVSRRIVEFCELPWDDACLRYHESKRMALTLSYAQVNKPIYRSSVKRAERFGSLLDPLRRALEDS